MPQDWLDRMIDGEGDWLDQMIDEPERPAPENKEGQVINPRDWAGIPVTGSSDSVAPLDFGAPGLDFITAGDDPRIKTEPGKIRRKHELDIEGAKRLIGQVGAGAQELVGGVVAQAGEVAQRAGAETVGKAVEGAGRKVVEGATPPDPSLGLFGTVGRATGSSFGFGGAAVAGAPAIVVTGVLASGFFEGEAARGRALAAGGSEQEAEEAAWTAATRPWTVMAGASEVIPIGGIVGRMLAKVDRGSGGKLKQALKNVLIEGGEEMLQEGGQDVVSTLNEHMDDADVESMREALSRLDMDALTSAIKAGGVGALAVGPISAMATVVQQAEKVSEPTSGDGPKQAQTEGTTEGGSVAPIEGDSNPDSSLVPLESVPIGDLPAESEEVRADAPLIEGGLESVPVTETVTDVTPNVTDVTENVTPPLADEETPGAKETEKPVRAPKPKPRDEAVAGEKGLKAFLRAQGGFRIQDGPDGQKELKEAFGERRGDLAKSPKATTGYTNWQDARQEAHEAGLVPADISLSDFIEAIESSSPAEVAEAEQVAADAERQGSTDEEIEEQIRAEDELLSFNPEDLESAPTSIRNEVVDRELAEMGLEPATRGEKTSFEQASAEAADRLREDPLAGQKLLAELDRSERGINGPEAALLTHERNRLRLDRERIESDLIYEQEEGGDPELIAELKRQAEQSQIAFARASDITTRVGTQTAQGLALRRMELKADYSIARMEQEMRAATGGKLNEAQTEELREVKKQLDAALKKLDKLAKKRAPRPRNRVLSGLSKEADKARARIKARRDDGIVKLYAGGFDSESFADEIIIGADNLARGIESFAAWSKAMIEDLGEGIRPFLEDLFKASKEALESKRTDAAVKALERSIAKLEKRIADGDIQPKKRNPSGDPRIEALLKRRDALISKLRKLQDASPEAEAKRVEGQKAAIADLEKRLAENDLESKKVGRKKRGPEHEELRKKRAELQAELAKRRRDLKRANSESKKKTPQQLARERLEKSIAELERKIEERDLSVRKSRPVEGEGLDELRAHRDELSKALQDLRKEATPAEVKNERRLKAYKKRKQTETAKVLDQLERGDLSIPEKQRTELDEEAVQLNADLQQAKLQFSRAVEKARLENRTKGQKAIDTLKDVLIETPRNVLSSWDLSAPGRQGIWNFLAHPVLSSRAMPKMFEAMFSERKALEVDVALRSRPLAKLGEAAKLELTTLDGALNEREETMQSRLADKIPGVAASNRAFTTFLNAQRAYVFDALIAAHPSMRPTLEEATDLARLVNIASGRGDPGRFAGTAGAAGALLWSPRLLLSRVQLLLGPATIAANAAGVPVGGVRGSTSATRKLMAREYARFAIGASGVYILAALAGYDTEKDPRASDFGKIKDGDTRVDPMGGLIQVIVLMSRLTSGKTKKGSGEISPIRGADVPYGQGSSDAVVGRFLRNKLNPTAGIAMDLLRNEDFDGNPMTVSQIAQNAYVPLAWQDLQESMQEQGIPKGAALTMVSMLGWGVQTYGNRTNFNAAAREVKGAEEGESLYRTKSGMRYTTILRKAQARVAELTEAGRLEAADSAMRAFVKKVKDAR